VQCVRCPALLQQPGVQQPGSSRGAGYCVRQELHLWGLPGCEVLWQGLPEGTLEAAQAGVQDAAGCSWPAHLMLVNVLNGGVPCLCLVVFTLFGCQALFGLLALQSCLCLAVTANCARHGRSCHARHDGEMVTSGDSPLSNCLWKMLPTSLVLA
jgi:hypothetical protein